MRGPKSTATIADNKTKKTKVDKSTGKKNKASSKNSGAPKRPPTAFFIFMEQFRNGNKENFPVAKSASAIAKEGGAIWKSMTESEKAPYFAKAARKKADYEIAIKQHIDNLNETGMEISTSSSMNTHEDVELEVNSQIVKVL
ncbi:high mobility group B protein 3-like [Helianthus annuus]|uniref:high mobility group B protein 3-like n=1 Tax=Helianthus annuus TaxID=4232 RepID=UPI000B8F4992|nr:high mobility group B protein 3-like [Helianthus annuus]